MGIIALNEVKTPSDALEFADGLVAADRRKKRANPSSSPLRRRSPPPARTI